MNVYLPWGLYAGALAALILYLQLLPDDAARRRAGIRPGLASWLFWPCALAVMALLVWPFFAAGGIHWEGGPPSIWLVVVTAIACGGGGWVMQYVVQMLVGAYLSGLGDDPRLLTAMRTFSGVVTVALLGLTVAAYWSVTYGGQMDLIWG